MTDDTAGHGRDELSRTLRQLRTAAGLSGVAAGRAAGFSQAKISRLENGRNVPTPEDVATLAKVYRVPAPARRRLEDMARDVRMEFRRVVLHRGAVDFQQRIGRIEESSERIRTFTATVVPGLVQTADYARAVFSSGGLSTMEVDAAVAARLDRQRLLDEDGRRFTLVMTEGALRWCASSPSLMVEQAQHIVAVTRLPNVRVGVIPWGTPADVFPLHSWDIYDHRAVIVGIATATALLTNRQDIDAYDGLFRDLERLAVFGDGCRQLLSEIARDYQLRGD